MRYIAKKIIGKKDEKPQYEVSGIKTMKDVDGNDVEVIFASKVYDKDKLVEVMNNYKMEFNLQTEQYTNDIDDMTKILKAIQEVGK
jgi:hypothetical protein